MVIGSSISGMACAVRCAQNGLHVTLVSPDPSERSQSVMAAGGINAVITEHEEGDSVACHIEDTLKGGCYLGGEKAVTGLCGHGEEILKMLVGIGTVFSVDKQGRPLRRAFGGQTYKRTYYCGASTGKQIVSALVMEARRYEAAGLIRRRLRCCFHSALIHDGVCYGALLYALRYSVCSIDRNTGRSRSLFLITTIYKQINERRESYVYSVLSNYRYSHRSTVRSYVLLMLPLRYVQRKNRRDIMTFNMSE